MTEIGPVPWFSELGMDNLAIAGGKGANLGELTRAGLPVPPGFVITAPAYLETMQRSGLRQELAQCAAQVPDTDPTVLTALAASLSSRIRDVEIPDALTALILSRYRELGASAVAVRSSATSEDTAATSFAGMNETFTNVQGEAELLTCIKDCWAAGFGARALSYRACRQLVDEPAIAVVIQAMVESERSGVIFSADPTTGDRGHVVIEAAFGLGEVVSGGQLIPDTYLLDSTGPRPLEIRIGYKDHQIVRGPEGHNIRVELSLDEATRRVLNDGEAVALAELAVRVQKHYGCPQDIEWAIQDGVTYLIQSRPITSLPAPDSAATGAVGRAPVHGRLVAGVGAASGVASGTVRILASPDHAEQFRDGEILVASTTSPDWMPILRRAAALVSDGGGITCHAAIVSRELGIPAIVGARTATHVLHDGQQVTVDGRRGVVEEHHPSTPPTPERGDGQAGRVVVGYDGSADSCAALDWASAEAQRRGLPLTVLNVVDYLGQLPGTLPTVPMRSRVERAAGHSAEQIAAEGVHRARKNAGSIDIAALTHVSRVAYSLIENSRAAALLVVGTRGHNRLTGTILGSVAFTVSAHAVCPVVVVRGDSANLPGPHRPVVVGVDGSPGSDAAVRFAAASAAAADAPLVVVSGYQTLSAQVWVEPDLPTRSFDSAARQAAEIAVEAAELIATADHPDLQVQRRVVQRAVAEALTVTASGAGLLVVGSCGRGGFAGLQLGAVSHAVIHSAPCPVAVIPPHRLDPTAMRCRY
jgi:nucleotide-binding universal stress UspA family protein/phosphohistidine swiveling domain-containing protein